MTLSKKFPLIFLILLVLIPDTELNIKLFPLHTMILRNLTVLILQSLQKIRMFQILQIAATSTPAVAATINIKAKKMKMTREVEVEVHINLKITTDGINIIAQKAQNTAVLMDLLIITTLTSILQILIIIQVHIQRINPPHHHLLPMDRIINHPI